MIEDESCVGAVSSAGHLVLYLLLRLAVGAGVADLTALLITAIGNTATNRRLTFGVRAATI